MMTYTVVESKTNEVVEELNSVALAKVLAEAKATETGKTFTVLGRVEGKNCRLLIAWGNEDFREVQIQL